MVTESLKKYIEDSILPMYEDSPNAARLEALRTIIRDEKELRARLNAVFDYLTNPHPNQCSFAQCQETKYRKAW